MIIKKRNHKLAWYYKLLIGLVAAMMVLPVASYLILQSSRVQTYLVNRVSEYIETTYETEFEVGRLKVRLFRSVVMEDLYLEDLRNDTLLYLPELEIQVDQFHPFRRHIGVKTTYLKSPYISIRQDTTGFNFDFLLTSFEKTTPAKSTADKGWNITNERFVLENASVHYFRKRAASDTAQWSDTLRANHLEMRVSDVQLGDTIRFHLENFAFNEKRGLQINHLSMQPEIYQGNYRVNAFDLQTPASRVRLDSVWLQMPAITDSFNFYQDVQLQAQVKPHTQLSISEWARWLPLPELPVDSVFFTGTFHGKPDSLIISNLVGGVSPYAYVQLDGQLQHLSQFSDLAFQVQLKRLYARSDEVNQLLATFAPGLPSTSTSQWLNRLQFINTQAGIAGAYDSIRVTGEITTALGEVYPHLRVDHWNQQSDLLLNGQVAFQNWQLNELLQNNDLGQFSAVQTFQDFRPTLRQPQGQAQGHIQAFDYRGYRHQHLHWQLKGRPGVWQAELKNSDALLPVSAQGRFQLGEARNQYQLSVHAEQLNLVATQLDTTSKKALLGFHLQTALQGTTLNDLVGQLRLKHLQYAQNEHLLALQSLAVNARRNTPEHLQVALNSDLADARVDINGELNTAVFSELLKNTVYYYLPSLYSGPMTDTTQKVPESTRIDYSVHLKETDSLMAIWLPGFSVSPNTTLSGDYTPATNQVNVALDSDHMQYNKIRIGQFQLHINTYPGELRASMVSEMAHLGNLGRFYQPNFDLYAIDDTMNVELAWQDDPAIAERYDGRLYAGLGLSRNKQTNNLMMHLKLFANEIYFAGSQWQINRTQVHMDSTYLAIDGFKLQHQNESIQLTGAISQQPDEQLELHFHQVNLNHLNPFLQASGMDLQGRLNGFVQVADVYQAPRLLSRDTIHQLTLNSRPLGDFVLNNLSLNSASQLRFSSFLVPSEDARNRPLHRRSKIVDFQGSYHLSSQDIDATLSLRNFFLNKLEPLVASSGVISDLKGLASADGIIMQGNIEEPHIEGILKLQRTSFLLDYLNTRYTFATDSLVLTEDEILLKDIKLEDRHAKHAFLSGHIQHDFFSNFLLDISLDLNDFKVLNTTPGLNEVFYGEAYATGQIGITGPTDNLAINVSAETGPNTRFYIPLSSGSELSESGFISFVRDTVTQGANGQIETDYEMNTSGLQLNFDLDVTPDAEVQLIMNESTGDVLRARGSGALQMQINTQGQFNMYGDYVINQGDYVFTLQNIMKKRFTIEEGSSIKWDGNPYNAAIDITTLYRVKNVSVYDLTLENRYKETQLPVNCVIELGNQLTQPTVDFGVNVPEESQQMAEGEQIESQLENLPQDELNKQFLSLLIINRFQPLPGFSGTGTSLISTTSTGISSNASELITNQLNNWLSQISDDFSMGINYNTSDSLSSSEVEVALSTQLINDRMRINGNISMGDQFSNPENYMGNFDLEYKITQNGKLRVKYYNKTNNDLIYDETPNKQGIGLFYQEEFNSLGELYRRYKASVSEFYQRLVGRKPK